MLNKLLFRNRKKLSLWVSFIGAFLGVNFLLLTTDIYLALNKALDADEAMGDNTVMIHKIVTATHALGVGSSDFDQKEIEMIRNKDFIKQVAPVKLNRFNVSIGLHEDMEGIIPYFRTDTYLNSVPTEFVDVENVDWDWTPDEMIPIIMPKIYITMLNHGFAQSYGMPKVSEDIAKIVKFKIEINYKGEKIRFDGKLAGFSQSINSVLVPDTFMDHCNRLYAVKDDIKPAQLMIKFEENAFGKFEDLLEKNNYEISKSAIDIAKIKAYVSFLMYFIAIQSILIIILAINGITLYSELIITRSLYEIRTLLRIGYGVNTILNRFLIYFLIRFVMIVGIAIGLLIFEKSMISPYFKTIGMELGTSISELSLLISIGILIGMVLINYIGTRITLVKTGKEKS